MSKIAMGQHHDLGAIARDIVDASAYMTLATADEAGQPWASPVWYAVEVALVIFFFRRRKP
jgi:hypothetical protein